MKSTEYRTRVIELIELLWSPSEQLRYETDVPHVNVVSEMISMYADETFKPKSEDFLAAFTELEIRDLAMLYGLVCLASTAFESQDVVGVASALKTVEWRSVIEFSKQLHAELRR